MRQTLGRCAGPACPQRRAAHVSTCQLASSFKAVQARRTVCRAGDDIPDSVVSGSSLLGGGPTRTVAQAKKLRSPAEELADVELKSGRGVDYEPLRQALLKEDFLEADDIHRKKLIEVAGEDAVERGWVYFTEVKDIPVEDLQTIDQLWLASSGGNFGFSVQKRIWKASNEKWARFFIAIDWLKGENQNYRAWPAEFVYNLKDATKGHLPLTNALRGTQLFEAIFNHPAFAKVEDERNTWG